MITDHFLQLGLGELDPVDGDDFLIGTAVILGTRFHFHAVRVVEVDGVQRPAGELAPDDEDFEATEGGRALQRLMEADDSCGDFSTVQIPGREGDWVVWLIPHSA